MNLITKCVIIAVLINLILPMFIKPFATKDQITPPQGAHNLSFFDQIIHMLIHHSQVPLTSSLIVGLVVGLSVVLARLI